MNIEKRKVGNEWHYIYKNITIISEVELPAKNGKYMVGMLNPYRVSIAYDFPPQDGLVKISAQSGVFPPHTVADLEIQGYAAEDFIKAAAGRLFRKVD